MSAIQETIVSHAVARITGADPHYPDLLVFIQQEDSMDPEPRRLRKLTHICS